MSFVRRDRAARARSTPHMDGPFALYLAIASTSTDAPPRIVRRQPTTDRPDTPFPAAVAAFALSSLSYANKYPREHTAVLTLADGSRLHVASLTVSPHRALLLLSRRPLLAQMLTALRALHAAVRFLRALGLVAKLKITVSFIGIW